MVEENIKKKAFAGVMWNYVNTFGLQILQLIPAMILARLLTPDEYGTVAIAGILTGFVTIFVDSGFSMALIQKKDVKQIDICSVYYFNIAMSVLIYTLLFFAAPLVASFFRIPEVKLIMRVSSFSMVIGAFGSIHNTLFCKEIEYRIPTIISLSTAIISAIVACSLAYLGFGYWALVVQGVLSTTTKTALNNILSKWRPSWMFSFDSLKTMFGFGSRMLGKSLTDYGFGKLYDVVIGRFYKPADLSYFNRANATQSLFTDTFLMVMNSVAFASFSKMQNDFVRMRANVLRFFKIESMLISFIMLLVIGLAEPIFHFMYSSKWDSVIPLFRIVCIWGVFRPISCVFANGLMAHGDSGACLRNSIIGRGLNVLLLLVTWKFGIMVMIAGQVLAYLIEIFLYTFSFDKVFKYNAFNMIRDISPYYTLSFILCLGVFAFDKFVLSYVCAFIGSEFVESFIRLVVCGLSGFFIFIIIHRLLKLQAYLDFREIVFEAMAGKGLISKIVQGLL